jgi:SecD/SecF fusion protein
MVFVLFIMGVSSLKEFTFTLMAGIVCGAYSSVCITGPLWYMLKTKLGKKSEKKSE